VRRCGSIGREPPLLAISIVGSREAYPYDRIDDDLFVDVANVHRELNARQ